MLVKVLIILGASAWLWISPAHSQISKSELGEFERELRSAPVNLHLPPVGRRVFYVQVEEGQAFYELTESALFRTAGFAPIRVVKLSGNDLALEIELRDDRSARGKISIYPPLGARLTSDTVRQIVHSFMDWEGTTAARADYIAHRRSGLLHIRGSNHLPRGPDRVEFGDLEAAVRAGHAPCVLCFSTAPRISDLEIERSLGALAAAQFRVFNQVLTDSVSNERVTRVGNQVLSRWVVPLRGFEYGFKVAESSNPNAFACPGGQIFVTTGMLNAIESDEELEALLAHEIAHVERRHGLAQFRSARRAGIVAGLIGGVVSVATGDATWGQLAQVLASIAAELALSGYSRAHEAEADAYALSYLRLRRPEQGVHPLRSVLAKLQFASTRGGLVPEGAFASHPGIEERISRAESGTVTAFDVPPIFHGLDGDGNPIVTVRFDAQAFFEFHTRRAARPRHNIRDITSRPGTPMEMSTRVSENHQLQLFVSVAAQPWLEDAVAIKSMTVVVDGRQLLFDNAQDTEIPPGEEVGINLVRNGAKGLLEGPIEGISLYVPAVQAWVIDRAP